MGFLPDAVTPIFIPLFPSSPKRKWGGGGGKRECFISLLSLLRGLGLGRAPYEVISGGGGGKSCVERGGMKSERILVDIAVY